jgi:hypothetical protein
LNISTASIKVAPKGGNTAQGGNVNFVVEDGSAADFRLQNLEDSEDLKGVHFRVQVESSNVQIPNAIAKFKRDDVYEYQHDGMYKYCLGSGLKTLDEAAILETKLRASGYPNAVVVAFNNRTRISLDQAKKLLTGQNK